MTRLIDADALNEKLCKTTIFIKDGEVFQRMINDAPTIEQPTGDLISRADALAEFRDGRDVYDIMESIEELPSADRPTEEVNAVKVYGRAEHDLLHNKITLGEYEKRIEPLKHMYYDRPTGEWMRLEREENVYDLHGVPTWGVNYMCDKCGFITTAIQDHFGQYKWCPSCGARMKGGAE